MSDRKDTRLRYIIYCADFKTAARYAADHDWHLSWWTHYSDSLAKDNVIVFERKV
jgi:hypothetical protein